MLLPRGLVLLGGCDVRAVKVPGSVQRMWTPAAGPVAHLLLFAAIALISGAPGWGIDSPRWVSQLAPIEAVQLENVICFLLAVAPTGGTDGHRLLGLLRNPLKAVERLRESHYLLLAHERLRLGKGQEAIAHYEAGLAAYPGSFLLRHDLAVALLGEGEFSRARQEFLALMETSEAKELSACALLKNNVAYSDLMLGDERYLEEADKLSSEALAEAPSTPSYRGTRGAVFVRKGQLREGRSLLVSAFRYHTDPRSRASIAGWIALAEARLGNQAAARKWLGKAVCESVDDPIVTVARREVEAMRETA